MDLKKINESQSRRPFKPVRGERGVKFRQTTRPDAMWIDVEHNGQDRVVFGVQQPAGDKSASSDPILLLSFDGHEAAQLASILFYLVEDHLRDGAESPFHHTVSAPERADFGAEWLLEEQNTAIERLNRRRSRSHVLGLMQRCLEVCEDAAFIKELTLNLALWARRSEDGFALQKAKRALVQMDMAPDEAGP